MKLAARIRTANESAQPFVYRVQDRSGRGPFRPGFSRRWCDDNFTHGMLALPTWLEEFGADLIEKQRKPEEFYGTAVRDPGALGKWFSPTEQARLVRLHFHVVSMRPTRILAESENQLVFARLLPLSMGVVSLPWRSIAEAA